MWLYVLLVVLLRGAHAAETKHVESLDVKSWVLSAFSLVIQMEPRWYPDGAQVVMMTQPNIYINPGISR